MAPIPLRTPVILGELRERLGGELDPQLEKCEVRSLGLPGDSQAHALSLLVTPRLLVAGSSGGGPMLVVPELAGRVPAGRRWVHRTPWWVMSHLLEDAIPDWYHQASASTAPNAVIDPSAIVHPGAVLGSGCRLEPHAVVYGGVVLGERVEVGAGSVIGRPGFGFAQGLDGMPRRIPQLGGVVVGDDVAIGALCTVDAGTLAPTAIGAHTKLDAQVHVGHNVRIGQRCMLAAQVGLAGSVEVGDSVWIGGQAGVADHVCIGAGARIAAKSGVISDVPANATVAGYPAVLRTRWLRGMAQLLRSRKQRRG